MKPKIQFINSYGKFHEYNFIKEALPQCEITVYSDTGYAKYASDEVKNYYDAHHVRVVKANSFDNIKNPTLRRVLNLFSAIGIIICSRKEQYDYCIIHFLSARRAILSSFIPRGTKQILVTYGSDILRRKDFNNVFFRRMLDRCYAIVETTGNIKYKLEEVYGEKYKSKSVYIPFPCASFDRLDDVINNVTIESALRRLDLPSDKKIVVCGHTSTHDEQFEKMIPAILKVPAEVLSLCHFVFPMTYGNGDYIEYREKIKKLLSNSGLNYTVLEEYLPYDIMAMLHLVSSVHITSITTDALSFFLLEELYCGASLLYGSWLHYIEFENEYTNAMTYNTFDELPIVFSAVILGKGKDIIPVEKEREYIRDIQSNEMINNKWTELLDN